MREKQFGIEIAVSKGVFNIWTVFTFLKLCPSDTNDWRDGKSKNNVFSFSLLFRMNSHSELLFPSSAYSPKWIDLNNGKSTN
jgi:hypothetical protein